MGQFAIELDNWYKIIQSENVQRWTESLLDQRTDMFDHVTWIVETCYGWFVIDNQTECDHLMFMKSQPIFIGIWSHTFAR